KRMSTDTKPRTAPNGDATAARRPATNRPAARGTDVAKLHDLERQLAAIAKTQAVVQFNLDRTVIDANEVDLDLMGYTLDEIVGKPHSTFVDQEWAESASYRENWEKIARGEPVTGVFRRRTKQGDTVWIRASYNPVLDDDGRPVKAVK